MEPMRKVIFNPEVDNFEFLSIKGLFDAVSGVGKSDIRMVAMSNGVMARPVV